jgi:hypothetical protein
VNDTFVNDLHRGDAIFAGTGVTQPVVAENDLSVGSPVFVSQAAARFQYVPLTGHVRRTDGGTIAGAFGSTGDP